MLLDNISNMPKLFKNPNSDNLTAKDYINKKRNETIYADVGNSGNSRKIYQQYNNGRLKSATNHENLLRITKGYYSHHQNIDISNSFFQNYDGQLFSTGSESCNVVSRGGSTNYTGEGLIMNILNHNTQQIQLDKDTKFSKVLDYGEIYTKSVTGDLSNNKLVNKVKCFQYPLSNLQNKKC